MSDYLQNLLARSLNPSRGVQPRLASLYEPRAAAFAPTVSDSFDTAEAETEPRPPDADEAARPERRTADAAKEFPRPAWPEAPTAPQQPFANASRQPDASRPAETRAERRIENDAAPRLSRLSAEEPAPPAPTPSSEEVRKHASQVEPARRDSEAARDVPAPAASVRPPAAEPRVKPAPAVRLFEPRIQPAPPQPPARPPQLSEERAQAEAAPTIRVTIGRVDVRAVAGVPQEKRRAPEQPRPGLTLEEYLRRRGGGRR